MYRMASYWRSSRSCRPHLRVQWSSRVRSARLQSRSSPSRPARAHPACARAVRAHIRRPPLSPTHPTRRTRRRTHTAERAPRCTAPARRASRSASSWTRLLVRTSWTVFSRRTAQASTPAPGAVGSSSMASRLTLIVRLAISRNRRLSRALRRVRRRWHLKHVQPLLLLPRQMHIRLRQTRCRSLSPPPSGV